MPVHIRGASIWDGIQGDVQPRDIVILGPNVGEILPPGSRLTKDATALELDGAVLIPGLVDMHVHLVWSGGADPALFAESAGEQAVTIRAVRNAGMQLRSGVTTVRDLGGDWDIPIAVAAGVARGDVDGPRIVASGRTVVMTGGHDPFWGVFSDGPDAVVRAVRGQALAGAEVIKLAATGGVYGRSSGEDIGNPELTYEEMLAAVTEAHRRGLRVAAHAVGQQGIRDAISAGVDTIEHGNFLNEEIVDAMAAKKIALCPTLAIYRTIAENRSGDIPAYASTKAKTAVKAHGESFRMALEAGIDIVAGTDAGSCGTAHPALVDELLTMRSYGMPAIDVLRSATSTAGRVLGRADMVGVLQTNVPADFLVLNGNPLDDLEFLRSPRAVVRAGLLIRPDVEGGLGSAKI